MRNVAPRTVNAKVFLKVPPSQPILSAKSAESGTELIYVTALLGRHRRGSKTYHPVPSNYPKHRLSPVLLTLAPANV